jgi:hypothetical protein
LESEGGFFWFAKPPSISGSDEDNHVQAIAWRVISDTADPGLWVTYFMRVASGDFGPIGHWCWRFGHSLAAECQDVAAIEPDALIENPLAHRWSLLRLIATAWAFLEQRILVIAPQRASRALRRRLPIDLRETLIHTIILRRQQPMAAATVDNQGDVEWSWRWIVRGHWRDQWYPSIGHHRPIWILPYEKGPAEKPLKMPGVPLFAVTR